MFQFKTNIIKRRRISKTALVTGLFAAALMGYMAITFLEYGYIPFVEKLVYQIGLTAYISYFYVGIFTVLFLLMLPAFHTIFKKKVVVGGQISFDEQHLRIRDGKHKYIIPEEQIPQINFELKTLPSTEKKKTSKSDQGGNWMKIPTSKGIHAYEMHLADEKEREALLEMIEFLKIQHDIEVKVKEIK